MERDVGANPSHESTALGEPSQGKQNKTARDSSYTEGQKVTEISIDEDGWVFVDGKQAFHSSDSHDDQSRIQQFRSILSRLVPGLQSGEEIEGIKPEQCEQLGNHAQRLLARQTRCSSLRGQAQPMRSELAYERQELRNCLNFLLESVQQAFSAFLNVTNIDPDLTSTQNSSRKLIEEDRERLNSQTDKLERLENALSNLEFRLQQEEEALEQQVKEFVEGLRGIGARIFRDMSDVQDLELGTAQSQVEVDPVLQNFYDKMGEAKVLHERLMNFEHEYSDAKSRIIFEEEHDRVPEMALGQLDINSSRKRQELQADLNQACEVAELARTACLKVGLDPEAYKSDLPDYDNTSRPQTPAGDIVANGESNESTPTKKQRESWGATDRLEEGVKLWIRNVPRLQESLLSRESRRRRSDSQLYTPGQVWMDD